MTVFLSSWLLPIAGTIVAWLAAIFYRAGTYQADSWGFAQAFDALARFAFAVLSTLLLWLVYFIARWWFG